MILLARWLPITLTVLVLCAVSLVHAESKKSEKSEAAPAKAPRLTKSQDIPAFTKEREAAALMFVRSHHAELADLLAQLKQHNKKEYEQGIRELFRDSERLAQWHDRSPKRYELELEAWKLHSRILVLVAKLTMATDPNVEQELRQTLAEEAELQRKQLVTERERLTARLVEIDQVLSRDVEAKVEARMEELRRGALPRRPPVSEVKK